MIIISDCLKLIFHFLQQINSTDSNDIVYHIRAERDEFVLGIQLINPFHNYTTEKLFIYDFRQVKNEDRIQVKFKFVTSKPNSDL